MTPQGLTIGQLAAHAGVTVRAVRHYHRRGLLAEPTRDASGYRRYDAQAVVDLIRIKTLTGAGVPLSRVQELLSAEPAEFSEAVAQIDKALRGKIRELTRHRRSLAELTEGDRLFLPAEIVDLLDQLRALGISERGVRMERDGWILGVAHLPPDKMTEWANEKRAALSDPEFGRLYLACDQALGWEADDPRLEQLAGWIGAWQARNRPKTDRSSSDIPEILTLMAADIANQSPAWRRLSALGYKAMESRPG